LRDLLRESLHEPPLIFGTTGRSDQSAALY
jgi:hypothetical protein